MVVQKPPKLLAQFAGRLGRKLLLPPELAGSANRGSARLHAQFRRHNAGIINRQS